MNDHEPLAGGGPASHDPGMEARLARVESDVGHIKSDISEIKNLLARVAPRIDEIYGKLPFLATKEDLLRLELGTKQDLARVELGTKEDLASTKQDIARFELLTKEDLARLAAEIEKRPTRRQTVVDVAMIVGLIGALITIGTRLAH
jgi:biopolymer transport protein ExbB/TolQ